MLVAYKEWMPGWFGRLIIFDAATGPCMICSSSYNVMKERWVGENAKLEGRRRWKDGGVAGEPGNDVIAWPLSHQAVSPEPGVKQGVTAGFSLQDPCGSLRV